MDENLDVRTADLVSEFERLESAVQEVSGSVQRLREEKRLLEQECERLRSERTQTVNRLSNLIEKVDALRGGN